MEQPQGRAAWSCPEVIELGLPGSVVVSNFLGPTTCPVGHESQCCRKVSEPARISPEMRVTVVLPAGVLWARGPGADGLEESLCYCGRARCESGLRPTGQQRGKAARATGCWRAAEHRRAAAGHHDAVWAL